MLEINTIAEFQALPANLQAEVQKALRTKDRLDDFLRAQNKKAAALEEKPEAHWSECFSCKPWGYPGWIWKLPPEVRDNSDIHPSQINKCIKNLWFCCNGYAELLEEHVDPRLRLIFDLGHAVHDMFQRYGRHGAWSASEHYHKEVKLDPDQLAFDGTPALPVAHQYWLKGACDALIDRYICYGVPGLGDISVRVAHEYKTINSSNYQKLTRPKSEHKFQATIYAAVFNVPLVVYLYLNKDNCYISDFPVSFDYSIWNEIVQRVQIVQHYTNAGEPPPWEFTSAVKNQAECLDCGFRKICNPPMTKLVAAPGTLPTWR